MGNKETFFVAHRENANLESIHALYKSDEGKTWFATDAENTFKLIERVAKYIGKEECGDVL